MPAPATQSAPTAAPVPVPPKPQGSPSPPAGGSPLVAEDPNPSWLQEAGTELEQIDEDTNKARPATRERPKPKPQETKTEPDDGLGELETKPEGEPGAKTEPETQTQPERPLKAPELRKAYEETQRKIKEEYEPKISRLESRVKELEESAPKEDPQTKERFTSLQKQYDEAQAALRFLAFERSDEYREKFQKPYVEAWDKCMADISQLTVEVTRPDGEVETRKASESDIVRLAQLPLGELYTESNKLFGDAADVVREHVREIIRTNNAQTKALEDAKKDADNIAKQRQTRIFEEQRRRATLWQETNTRLAEKYPKWFKPVEGDIEGNTLLNKGLALTSLVFQNGKLAPEQIKLLPPSFREEMETKGQLSEDSTVRLHAIIRNKAANHDRLARQVRVLEKQLADTKKSLSAYEDSEPGTEGATPGRKAAGGGQWYDEPNAELEELDRKGR